VIIPRWRSKLTRCQSELYERLRALAICVLGVLELKSSMMRASSAAVKCLKLRGARQRTSAGSN
jgi:hypothetical protein